MYDDIYMGVEEAFTNCRAPWPWTGRVLQHAHPCPHGTTLSSRHAVRFEHTIYNDPKPRSRTTVISQEPHLIIMAIVRHVNL